MRFISINWLNADHFIDEESEAWTGHMMSGTVKETSTPGTGLSLGVNGGQDAKR